MAKRPKVIIEITPEMHLSNLINEYYEHGMGGKTTDATEDMLAAMDELQAEHSQRAKLIFGQMLEDLERGAVDPEKLKQAAHHLDKGYYADSRFDSTQWVREKHEKLDEAVDSESVVNVDEGPAREEVRKSIKELKEQAESVLETREKGMTYSRHRKGKSMMAMIIGVVRGIDSDEVETTLGKKRAGQLGQYVSMFFQNKPDALLIETTPAKLSGSSTATEWGDAFQNYGKKKGVPVIPVDDVEEVTRLESLPKHEFAEEASKKESMEKRNQTMAKNSVDKAEELLGAGKKKVFLRLLTGAAHVLDAEYEREGTIRKEVAKLRGSHQPNSVGDFMERELRERFGEDVDFKVRYDRMWLESSMRSMMWRHYKRKVRKKDQKSIDLYKDFENGYRKRLKELHRKPV